MRQRQKEYYTRIYVGKHSPSLIGAEESCRCLCVNLSKW